MSEPISPPRAGNWFIHTNVTELVLRNNLALSGHRLISIKRCQSGLFAAVSVENPGRIAWDWTPGMSEGVLRATLVRQNARLIALDAYEDANGGTQCAGVWIANDGVWSNWHVDLTASQVKPFLTEEDGKLTTLRTYAKHRPHVFPPGSVIDRLYAAIWVKNDGEPWDYSLQTTEPVYYKHLVDDLQVYDVVSNDAYDDGGVAQFAVVSWKRASANGSYWFSGYEAKDLDNRARGLCCYPLDVCETTFNRFGICQFAYPPASHPTEGLLLDFGGTAVLSIKDDEGQRAQITSRTIRNVTASPVTLTHSVRFMAGPGGWCWFWMADLTATDHGLEFKASTPLPPMTTSHGENWVYESSQPMHYFATQVEAKSAAGVFQEVIQFFEADNAPLQPLDLKAPVSIGLQGPLEILLMTNGKRYLEVRGQVINFSSRPCSIQGIFLRLVTPSNTTAYHAVVPLKFRIDSNADGTPLKTDIEYDPGIHQDRPLPRFRHLIEAPADFSGGQLEVDLHVQMAPLDPAAASKPVECYSNKQTFPVIEGRIQPIVSPLKGRVRWGSGPAAADWNAHWFFHERYCYDMTIVDQDNRDHTGAGTKNEDFLCWDKPVFAIADGEVIFVVSGEPDHGLNPAPGTGGNANMVVIRSGDLDHVYVHFKQSSVRVAVGQNVTQGDEIGRVGNTGNSSGPHLHFGVGTFEGRNPSDTSGVFRPLAVSLDARDPRQVPQDLYIVDIP